MFGGYLVQIQFVLYLKYTHRLIGSSTSTNFMMVIPGEAGAAKAGPRQERTSGNIRHLQYDHNFKSTSGALFRANHANQGTGVVQMTIGQSSEVLGSGVIGSRDPVNKWKGGLRRARCNVLRKIAIGVMFWVHLRRNIMEMYLRSMDGYALEHLVVLVRRHLEHALHPGIHRRGSIARVSLVKGSPIVEPWKSLTANG